MGKTTNILDLNNRLERVEKENIAQNNYNSLKNRPKINGNLLTGDKTGTQLGLANAQDVGNPSDLNTTDKSSCVGAINEVNDKVGYEERTTRESTAGGVYVYNNSNFLSSGYVTITKVGNKMSICVSGISTKSNSDWIVEINDGYRPATQNDRLYFKYFLGSNEYTGFIVEDGHIFFDNLNTTDLLSANIEFNISV